MSTRKEDTRYRLFEAARKLLLKRGFHGVGLEDIAEAAGVSRQAVYKSHFASKADLLLELVRHVHVAENLDELTRPVFEAKTALEMLKATIRASVKIEARVHELSLVLAATAVSDDGAAAAWRAACGGVAAGGREQVAPWLEGRAGRRRARLASLSGHLSATRYRTRLDTR